VGDLTGRPYIGYDQARVKESTASPLVTPESKSGQGIAMLSYENAAFVSMFIACL
jgi:hypothetical protein